MNTKRLSKGVLVAYGLAVVLTSTVVLTAFLWLPGKSPSFLECLMCLLVIPASPLVVLGGVSESSLIAGSIGWCVLLCSALLRGSTIGNVLSGLAIAYIVISGLIMLFVLVTIAAAMSA